MLVSMVFGYTLYCDSFTKDCLWGNKQDRCKTFGVLDNNLLELQNAVALVLLGLPNDSIKINMRYGKESQPAYSASLVNGEIVDPQYNKKYIGEKPSVTSNLIVLEVPGQTTRTGWFTTTVGPTVVAFCALKSRPNLNSLIEKYIAVNKNADEEPYEERISTGLYE